MSPYRHAPRQQALTKTVEVSGVSIRLYGRPDRGGTIYRGVRLGGGAKDRQSLHTSDRAHATQLAEALARQGAHLKHAGRVGRLTFGQLAALYRAERVPLLSPTRQRPVRGHLALFARHFAGALPVDDLSQDRVEADAPHRGSASPRVARRRQTVWSPHA